jgi:hypothetical protein
MKLLLDLSFFFPSLLISMAIFHVVRKLDLTILVFYFGVVQMTYNVFCAMFVFWRGSVHVSNDVSYAENNIVLNFVY